MGRSRVNRIIEGKEQGESMIIRGNFVRIKIWQALLNAEEPLQSIQITDLTDCSYEQVKSWLDVWVEFGYVIRTSLGKSPTGGKRYTHEVVDRTPLPPAITLKGLPRPPEHRQLLWEAMRKKYDDDKIFCANDLLDCISNEHGVDVNYDYTISYLRDLYHACYLIPQNSAGRDPWYRLKYNTGAFSPSLCRKKRVFDANLGVMVN